MYSCNEEAELSTESDTSKDQRLNERSMTKRIKLSTPVISKKKSRTYVKPKKKMKIFLDINSEEKHLNLALLELFKEKPYLWHNDRKRLKDEAFIQKGYESIASDINAKFSKNVTWVFVKNRINDMRYQCSDEIEKQLNGEEFEMPWYYEHMKYLDQNLQNIVRERVKHKVFVTIDESKLLIFIEIYKKHVELWQVNNIYFGITAKRAEIYNRMLEELRSAFNTKITLSHLKVYINHLHVIYSKDKERELKCEVDKSPFTPASNLYEKLTFLKDSKGPFKCPHCNEIIKTFQGYHIHVAEHNGTKPFKCLRCEGQFKKFNNYITHVKRHLTETSYPCDVCGKCFAVKSHLDKHKPIHNFICEMCDASFRRSSDYDRHMLRHEKRYPFQCHMCNQGFKQLNVLNDHIKGHLNVRDKLCNICGKGFTSSQNLRKHKLLHEDKKRYKCHICGREFAQGASLRIHRIRIHCQSTNAAKNKKETSE